MNEELAALAHELKRLRSEGVQSVYIGDDAMKILQAKLSQVVPRDSTSSASAPSPHRIELGSAPAQKKEIQVPESPAAPPPPTPPRLQVPTGTKQSQWEAIHNDLMQDAYCNAQLSPGKKLVFGKGNLDADIFFCGEAPGAEEEEKGEPFVGPAGQLLGKIISAMGLSRETVYISNIMNFRPPMPSSFGNRPPTTDEMNYCLPYLQAQLSIVKPRVIVSLGKTAADGLLGIDPKRKMSQIRGNWLEFAGTPLIPTFHPSYLLRNNTNRTKRMVWEDLLKVMEKLELPISEKQRHFFL